MSISKREKKLLVLVSILLLISVLYFFFYNPFIEDYEEANIFLQEKITQLNDLKFNNVKLEKMREDITELEQELDTIMTTTPIGFDQPPIIVFLEETLQGRADKVFFGFTRLEDHGVIETISANVSMVTEYEGFKEILNIIENGPYNNSIESIIIGVVLDEAESPAPETGLVDETQAKTVVVDTIPEGDLKLSITLNISFYNIKGEIPKDRLYPFKDDITVSKDSIFTQ